jgi:hypothetical protein
MMLSVVRSDLLEEGLWPTSVGRRPAKSPAGGDVNSRRLLRIYLREPGVLHT